MEHLTGHQRTRYGAVTVRWSIVSLLVAALFVQVAAAAAISHKVIVASHKVIVAGTISALQPSWVTVRGSRSVTCRVQRVSPTALGYVIGSDARITCVRGTLTKIVDTITSPPITKSTSASVNTSAASSSVSASVSPTVTTTTGPVISLSQSAVTVGSTTCSVGDYTWLVANGIGVGSNVTLTCFQLPNGLTLGSVLPPGGNIAFTSTGEVG